MTRKLLTLVLFTAFAGSIFAQRDSDSPFRFGLNFMPALTWNKTGKGFSPDGTKFGFEYGLNVHYYFYRNVGIETGFYMSHMGAKFKYEKVAVTSEDTSVYKYKFDLNGMYAKIPLALRFRTNQIGPVYLFGNFGVEVAFPVQARAKFSGSYRYATKTENDLTEFAQEAYKVSVAPVRLGLFLGGGVEYPISGSFSITANIQYSYGFLNILRDDMGSKKNPFMPRPVSVTQQDFPYTTPDKEDVRMQYLGLNVGVLF